MADPLFIDNWAVLDNGGGDSSTVENVAPSGGTLFAIVGMRGSGSPQNSNLTFNSTEQFTLIDRRQNGTGCTIEAWELTGASETIANVVSTIGQGSSFDTTIYIAEYFNVDQATPSDAVGLTGGDPLTITTNNDGSVIFGGFVALFGTASVTFEEAITELFNEPTGPGSTDTVMAVGELAAPTAGLYSFDATRTNTNTTAGIAIEIKGAVGSPVSGDVSIDAEALVEATGAKGGEGNTTVEATAAVETTGSKATGGTTSVDTSATVEAAGSKGSGGHVDSAATAEVATTGAKGATDSVDIGATGQVSATGSKHASGSVGIEQVASIEATGTAATAGSGGTSIEAVAGVSATGTKGGAGATTLEGRAVAVSQGAKGGYGVAGIVATPELAAQGIAGKVGSVSVEVTTTLTAEGSSQRFGSVVIQGVAVVSAAGSSRSIVSVANLNAVYAPTENLNAVYDRTTLKGTLETTVPLSAKIKQA